MKSKRENSKSLMLKKEDKNMTKIIKKKKNNLKVPNLRFPGFEGEWETKTLGEIATFSKGKGISKIDIEDNGKIECIRYGELYTHYKEIINEIKSLTNVNEVDLIFSEVNDVIIPASGESAVDIATASCVLKDKVALGGDLNIIKTNNNGVFLAYYLNNKKKLKIASLAQGVSVVHLYSSQLATLSLNLPKLNEQKKISSFLALLDERIHTQNKIIEELETLKINISKKIFSQELQFKEKTKKWKEVRLDEIATFFSGGTPLTSKKSFFDGDIPFIRSGEINSAKTEQFISELGLKKSSAKMVEIGDILYALYGATSGEIGISKIKGAINQAILCIRTSENNYFIYSYLLYKKESIISTYLQGGQGNLSSEIVKQIKIPLPPITIQNKVATIFMSIDNKIKIEKQMLNSLSKQKKYLLQQMFT